MSTVLTTPSALSEQELPTEPFADHSQQVALSLEIAPTLAMSAAAPCMSAQSSGLLWAISPLPTAMSSMISSTVLLPLAAAYCKGSSNSNGIQNMLGVRPKVA
jgi:hypothetical protein